MQRHRTAGAWAEEGDKAGANEPGAAVRRQVKRRISLRPSPQYNEAGHYRRNELRDRAEPRKLIDAEACNLGDSIQPLVHPLRYQPLAVDRRGENPHEQHLTARPKSRLHRFGGTWAVPTG